MFNSIIAAFKEKEVKKEEEEKGLQVHFDSSSCVDIRIDRVCLLSRFSQQQTFAFVHTLSSLCIRLFLLCHSLQFLMKELTFIHSIIDRSSIVLVQIPLKTARFSSFSGLLPAAEFICLAAAAAPHIFNPPSVITGREGLLNCKFKNHVKFSRKKICSQLQMTAQI